MRQSQHGPIVNPDRLCAAADMLLSAIQSRRASNSRVKVYAGPPRRTGRMCNDAFTCDELIEAMSMLIRMGLVSSKVAGSRSRPRH